MAKAKKKVKKTKTESCKIHENYCSSYFLGAIGAAVYYISTASSFWTGFLGLLKALVWPAFLTYEVLKFIAA